MVVDPWAEEADAMHEYGVHLTKMEDLKDLDCIIVAIAHQQFKEMGLDQIKGLFREGPDEEKVLNTLDEMTEQAFDDQCTGANPRYPLISEIKQMYLNAYYGKHFTEPNVPGEDQLTKKAARQNR